MAELNGYLLLLRAGHVQALSEATLVERTEVAAQARLLARVEVAWRGGAHQRALGHLL